MPEDILNQNIIKELGIENLPEEKKIALLEKMTDLVQKQVAVRVFDVLSEEDNKEFQKLLDAGNQEKTNEFLSRKVPNMQEIMEQEIIEFKKQAKSHIEKLNIK